MPESSSQPRWYHPTPGRFLVGLLAAEGLFFVGDRFGWFLIAGIDINAFVLLALAGVAILIGAIATSVSLSGRFQFGLRSLLLFVLVAGMGLGLLGIRLNWGGSEVWTVTGYEEYLGNEIGEDAEWSYEGVELTRGRERILLYTHRSPLPEVGDRIIILSDLSKKRSGDWAVCPNYSIRDIEYRVVQ